MRSVDAGSATCAIERPLARMLAKEAWIALTAELLGAAISVAGREGEFTGAAVPDAAEVRFFASWR